MPTSNEQRQDLVLYFKNVHLVPENFEVERPPSSSWLDIQQFFVLFKTCFLDYDYDILFNEIPYKNVF